MTILISYSSHFFLFYLLEIRKSLGGDLAETRVQKFLRGLGPGCSAGMYIEASEALPWRRSEKREGPALCVAMSVHWSRSQRPTEAAIDHAPVSKVWLGCRIPVGPQVVLGGVEAEESM